MRAVVALSAPGGRGNHPWGRAAKGAGLPPACCVTTDGLLTLHRVGAQPPAEAAEGACLGECPGPAVWRGADLLRGWC